MGLIRIPIRCNLAVNHFIVIGDAKISLELLLLIPNASFELDGMKKPYFVCSQGNEDITLYKEHGELEELRLEPELDVLFSFSRKKNDLSDSRFISEIFLPKEKSDILSRRYSYADLLYHKHLILDRTRMTDQAYEDVMRLVKNLGLSNTEPASQPSL